MPRRARVRRESAKAGKLLLIPAWPEPGQPEETTLAKPNYSFEKRQRELAKKKKQEQKRLERLANKSRTDPVPPAESPPTPSDTTTS